MVWRRGDAKYIISTGNGDDAFDWDSGWRGFVQYAIGQHPPDRGDNGIEADNNPLNNQATPPI